MQESGISPRLAGWHLALGRAPQFLSVLLLFALPFLTQVRGDDPIFPKWVLLQCLASLMVGIWFLRAYVTGKLEFVHSGALWALAALGAWVVLSFLLSDHQAAGLPILRDHALFLVWYLLLTFTCLEVWRAENLLMVFLVAAFGSALWACAQTLGIGEGPWLSIAQERFGGRPTAGFGNPDFLAGHLLLAWPMILGLLVRAQRPFSRIFWGGALVACFSALVMTGSKAGWVGLLTGLLVFGVFLIRGSEKRTKLWVAGLGSVLLLSTFASPMGDRLRGSWDPTNESLRFREQVWGGTLGMIQDHPFLGMGFGSFATVFPAYRPPSLMMDQVQRSYEVDHAHNWVLEWTAENGLPGLFLLCAFWFFVFGQWWKLHMANAIPRPLTAGYFAAATGIAVSNLFTVNSYYPSTLVPLLFLSALPVALSQRFYRMPGFPIQRKSVDLGPNKVYFLPVLALVGAASVWQVSNALERQWADVVLRRAAERAEAGNFTGAIELYDGIVERTPGNMQALYFRGSALAARRAEGDLERSLADLRTVEGISPDYVQVHSKLALVLEALGRSREAKVEMQRAVRIDPPMIFRVGDFQRARELVKVGRVRDALSVYQGLVLDYPACIPLMVDHGNALALRGKSKEAELIYRQVLDLHSGNREARANLAALLKAREQ